MCAQSTLVLQLSYLGRAHGGLVFDLLLEYSGLQIFGDKYMINKLIGVCSFVGAFVTINPCPEFNKNCLKRKTEPVTQNVALGTLLADSKYGIRMQKKKLLNFQFLKNTELYLKFIMSKFVIFLHI